MKTKAEIEIISRTFVPASPPTQREVEAINNALALVEMVKFGLDKIRPIFDHIRPKLVTICNSTLQNYSRMIVAATAQPQPQPQPKLKVKKSI